MVISPHLQLEGGHIAGHSLMVPIQWFHPWHLNLDLLRFGGPTHLARQAEKNTHKTKGLGTVFSHRIFGLRI